MAKSKLPATAFMQLGVRREFFKINGADKQTDQDGPPIEENIEPHINHLELI